jgi:hypothetical protein
MLVAIITASGGAGAGQPESSGAAAAGSQQDAGAEAAFNSAKELGTVEAWDAFLSNFPKGFYADLARAYVKKLSDGPPAVASPATTPTPAISVAAAPPQELSCSARSGLRSANSNTPAKITFVNTSGMYRSIQWIGFNGEIKDYGGLNAGDQIILDTYVTHPWMISTGPGDCLQIFLPEAGAATVQLVRLAADDSGVAPSQVRNDAADPPPSRQKAEKKKLVCGKNYKLRNGECVLVQNCGKNAYRSAEGDCYCKGNYQMRGGKCVWKTDKNGFEVAPWKKTGCSGWQAQCSQGIGKACSKYEENCQVN